jgi:VanZ family protein
MPPADTALPGRFAPPLAFLTLAYTLVLVLATHYPKPEDLLGPDPPSDKTLHFIAYGVLGILAMATLAASGRRSLGAAAMLLITLAILAAVDEATQPLFGRTAELWDWVYDLMGLGTGVAIVAIALRTIARRPLQ